MRGRKGIRELFDDLRNKGYARVRVDGTVYRSTSRDLDQRRGHTIEVVVDRLVVKATSRARITDSVETALKLADGVASPSWSTGPRTTRTGSCGSPSTCPARTGTRWPWTS